ncbi:MAG: hypothetical protein N2316_04215 [Spirochaetes bacterium]|nr:hypothetical protein [Spirochaetota bacterium]
MRSTWIVIFCAWWVPSLLFSQEAGSRAAFTRGGFVGAKYAAMGKAAEVIVDDVFAIYWNPAGLVALKSKEHLTAEEIRSKAKKGDVSAVTEDDLIRFSDEEGPRTVIQIGASAALLDVEREAGFSGIAFTAFKGVVGMGVYGIQSLNIESRDESGNYVKSIAYRGGVGYVSYAWISGITSIGVSMKGLYETIGDITYTGSGVDVGVQTEVVPFLRVGCMVSDIASGLKPIKEYEYIENEYDFATPTIKVAVALTSRESDFVLAITGVRKLESKNYELNLGISYALADSISLYGGLNNSYFTTGISINILNIECSYAFSYDNVNSGYNNMVSVLVEF